MSIMRTKSQRILSDERGDHVGNEEMKLKTEFQNGLQHESTVLRTAAHQIEADCDSRVQQALPQELEIQMEDVLMNETLVETTACRQTIQEQQQSLESRL